MNDAGQYDETVNGAAMGAPANGAPYEACPGVSDDSPTVIGAPVQSASLQGVPAQSASVQSAPMQIQGAVPVADAVPYGASYAAPVQGAPAQFVAPQPAPQQAFAQQQAGFVPQVAGGAAVPASMAPANGIAPGVSQPGVSQGAAPVIASQEFISQDLSRLAQTSGAAKEQFLAAYNAGYDVELPGDVARRAAESRRVASMSGNGAATPAPVAPYAQNGAPYAAPYGVSPANVAPSVPGAPANAAPGSLYGAGQGASYAPMTPQPGPVAQPMPQPMPQPAPTPAPVAPTPAPAPAPVPIAPTPAAAAARPRKSHRGVILAVIAALLIVLGTGGYLAWTVFQQRNDPGNIVQDYMNSLAAGSYAKAADQGDPDLPQDQRVLLADAVASQSQSRIANVQVGQAQPSSNGGYSIPVSYDFAGDHISDTLSVVPAGRVSLTTTWKISKSLLNTVTVYVPNGAQIEVNGVAVSDRNIYQAAQSQNLQKVDGYTAYVLAAYPANYSVTISDTGSKYISGSTETTIVEGSRDAQGATGESKALQLKESLANATDLAVELQSQAQSKLDACVKAANQSKPKDSTCPINYNDYNWDTQDYDYRNIAFSITRTPTVSTGQVQLQYSRSNYATGDMTDQPFTSGVFSTSSAEVTLTFERRWDPSHDMAADEGRWDTVTNGYTNVVFTNTEFTLSGDRVDVTF